MKKALSLSAATLALLVVGATAISTASADSVKAEQWTSTGTIGFTANTTPPPDVTNPEVPNLDLEVLRGLLQLTTHLIWILVRMKFQPHKLLTMQVQTQKHFLNRLEHLYKCTIFVVWVLGMELH